MQALGAVVDNVDNYEEALSPLLGKLGRKHIQQQIQEFFNAFEAAPEHFFVSYD